jgi:stage V sporulation protein G
MKIEVKIFPAKKESKIKAFANIVIEDAIKIEGFKVIEGEKGTFIGMPSTKDAKGDYKDLVYPISNAARKMLTDAILNAYNKKEADDSPF